MGKEATVGNKLLIASFLLIALVVGLVCSAVYYNVNPVTVVKEVPKVEKVTEYVDVVRNVSVEVPVEVEVLKEVLVDNGNLALVMDFVQDHIDEDLSVAYIVFETNAKKEGTEFIEANIVGLLDDEDFFDDGDVLEDYRKSEVSVKKVYDPEVLDFDYEDLDLTLKYEVKIKAQESGEDRVYFNFNVTIPFEDGAVVEDDVVIVQA